MGYKIPSDEEVRECILEVLAVAGTVGSQRKLSELVIERLRIRDGDFRLAGNRARRLAAQSDFVRLEIRARPGDPKRILRFCPVCGEKLKHLRNRTIWGGEVTIELKCPACPYWTGKRKRIPTRYFFSLRN
ncbi:MAG: hypothetical protein CVT48_00300 [Thermoplasmata archaeon HGW-Thermoplasmata-1]|nr:MAG: hypothetical protein CVT48_00300 [Thermoplasmata archaeon HGW-Thermoplasmata-1]